MGQNIGCEYSRVCECLDFAAVNEDNLRGSDIERCNRDETERLPKRFPHHLNGLLQKFYLDSRRPIYECNDKCACGPNCKSRLVQKGRNVPLQIFKTEKRGWGLRCQVDLIKGQFIDTYRGEIITDEEATAREEKAGLTAGLKASYLYSLDKHAVDDDDPNPHALKRSECYVVDGETQGGPTRFINHSCDPNVRQFTVSYNKYDERIYELAFFALKNVPAMTELTFDYQDKDEEDEEDMELDEGEEDDILGTQESATSTAPKLMECQCGSKKCRKKLWM